MKICTNISENKNNMNEIEVILWILFKKLPSKLKILKNYNTKFIRCKKKTAKSAVFEKKILKKENSRQKSYQAHTDSIRQGQLYHLHIGKADYRCQSRSE